MTVLIVLIALLFCGCQAVMLNGAEVPATLRAPLLERPADPALPPWLEQRPKLFEFSSWDQSYLRNDPYPARLLGGMAVGNGQVFALEGLSLPLDTLHNVAGPDYQLESRFFSDIVLELRRGLRRVHWERQRIRRVAGTAVNVIDRSRDGLSLYSIDFAPRGAMIEGSAAQRCLVRLSVVHNNGPQAVDDLELELRSVLGSSSDELIVERIEGTGRNLAIGTNAHPLRCRSRDGVLRVRVGDLQPGEQFICAFFISFADGSDARTVLRQALQSDPEALLSATIDDWRSWMAAGAQVRTSDQRFDELLEALLVAIRVQTASSGAVCEMSRYSFTWLRDIMGPALLYPLLGRIDEYRAMLDYYWLAALDNGGTANALPINVAGLPKAQPDWESLPTGSGREAAESVSYAVLHYREYVQASGDWELLRQRYGMLRHALIHQDLRHGCLLPFSDDETFRGSLAAAQGIWAGSGLRETHLSANSSFLFVAAAQFMERAALELDLPEHAAQYRRLADDVRQCTERFYWLSDERCYSPALKIDSLQPLDEPFVDVTLKPLWCGYLDRDDPRAYTNLESIIELLPAHRGLVYSPLHPYYQALAGLMGFHRGICTGMSYGFYLDNLAQLDHPQAEALFAGYSEFFHPTGTVSEYHVVDDFGRLVYRYDDQGVQTDQTAAYRSWEAGVDAAAMLRYLFGLELDAPRGRIVVAPHLPAGMDFARLEGTSCGATRFDLAIERLPQGLRVVISGLDGPLSVDARLSLAGPIDELLVNGRPLLAPSVNKWDRWSMRTAGLSAGPDTPLTIEVRSHLDLNY
ncbi:MAG: hypothetical protein P9M14_01790 [Candidatus Alcyoniella australis]|nr:hypothetical protein [Candidatus Alcyoniella australis]